MKSLEPKNCHVVSSPNWSSGELRFSCTVWVWDKISMTVCWNYDIICIHIYLYIFIYLHTHTNTLAGSVCIYIYIFLLVYIYTHHIFSYLHIYYIFTYVSYIYIHAYIYIHMYDLYMYISKLWVEIFWCILFGVTGVMFLWGMVTDACRWTATPVCRGTLTTVKGLKWVKVTIEVWSFASKVRKVGGDLQNLHIWGNLCECWIWIWRKGFFDNGIVRESGKKA